MRPQTLISLSIALFLGLMTVVFTGTEAALKAKAVPMKSATPAKRALAPTARINIFRAVLKSGTAKTKGKLSLKVTLHNPTATKASAFTVKVLHRGREVGKTTLKGLGPRARVSRTLRLNLPKQKGQPCVTVRLVKSPKVTLKLGTPRRTCLKSSMVRRGISKTKPGMTRGRIKTPRGKLENTSKIGIKSKVGIKTTKGKTRLGVKYITINNTLDINGQNMSITVYQGQTATVNWTFPTTGLRDNPNQVTIRVHLGDFSPGPDECKTGDPNDWRSGPHGLSGSIVIPLTQPPFQAGQTYQVKACLENSGTGNTGDESNVVALRYENPVPKPDLTVTDIYLEGSWVVFTAKNSGNGVKLPTSVNIGGFPPRIRYKPIKYEILQTLPGSGGGYSTSTTNGSSQSLGKALLNPGQTINVKTSLLGYMRPNWQVRICVNTDRTQLESNYSNNCLTKLGSEIERKSYDVFVTLFKIDVHDSGDNVSPGDWRVTLFTGGGGSGKQTSAYWPNENDTTNVRSGKSYYPRLVISYTNVKADETLELGMFVVECDSGIDLPPLSTILNIIMSPCSGEEVWELSGKDSHVFADPINIAPADWQQSGKIITRRVTRGEIDGTFHFKVYGAY